MIDALPEIVPLLADLPFNELGPGASRAACREQLTELEQLLAPRVKDISFAAACRAGLWLAYDFLDESHWISQDLDTLEGSYWHALMHRREPDYGNSKYWFRRVPEHPIFTDLAKQAATLASRSGSGPLARQSTWDPFAFVDLCESAAREGGKPRTIVSADSARRMGVAVRLLP